MKFSIVIISKDNRAILTNCLEKLLEFVPSEVEVVVESGENISDLKYPVQHIKLPLLEAGYSNQRNIGVKNAGGDYIIFIDDDVEVTESWFYELTKEIQEPENLVGVMGAVFPGQPNIIGFCEGVLGHPGGGFRLHNFSKGKVIPLSQVATCNTIIKKSVIQNVCWFDLKNRYGSEDTDLSIRITEKFGNNAFRYVPDAVVWHYPRNNFFKIIKWYIRRGKADADLFLKHTVHTNYLISTSIILKLLPVIVLSVIFGWIILPVAFFVWYFLQISRTRFMFNYFHLYNFSKGKRIITFFVFPCIKLTADVMFDIGRIVKLCSK